MNFLDNLWQQAHLAPAFRAIVFTVLSLGALAGAACIALVIHHGFTSTRRRQRGRLVEQATPFLAPHIATGDRLREAVAESRSTHGDWATAIVLREARHEVRGDRAQELSDVLREMGEVERLRKLARSHQDWRRVQAMRELGQCGGDEAQAALLEATTDRSPVVRRAAREGLILDGRLASIKAAIHSYLADAPSGAASKRSFYARLAAAAASELHELLRSGDLDKYEEKLAIEALGETRNPEVVPLARARLEAPEPEMRATAARVVGKLGDEQSATVLVRLLDDPEWFVRAAAAKAFETISADEAARRALSGRLGDEAWWVRANAAHALSQQKNGGVDALVAAVEGQDNYSRDAAMSALGLALLTPDSRRQVEGSVARIGERTSTAPLRQLLAAVPGGARQ